MLYIAYVHDTKGEGEAPVYLGVAAAGLRRRIKGLASVQA